MASSSVKFTYSDTTISITGPVYEPQSVGGPVRYVSGVSAGGTPYSYKKNNATRLPWTMQLELSAAEYLALYNFFYTTVGGPTYPFTFESTNGNSYSARFADNALNALRLNQSQWTVSLNLVVGSRVI